jgi:hypothetical protein
LKHPKQHTVHFVKSMGKRRLKKENTLNDSNIVLKRERDIHSKQCCGYGMIEPRSVSGPGSESWLPSHSGSGSNPKIKPSKKLTNFNFTSSDCRKIPKVQICKNYAHFMSKKVRSHLIFPIHILRKDADPEIPTWLKSSRSDRIRIHYTD